MLGKVYLFLRRLYWRIVGRCPKCGVMKIDWGYMSSSTHCPLCELKLHENEVYRTYCPYLVEHALNDYKRIWGKQYTQVESGRINNQKKEKVNDSCKN